MKIIVLGASGMLGHVMLAELSARSHFQVVGTVRSAASVEHLAPQLRAKCTVSLDVNSADELTQMFELQRPDVVINCVGLVKQLAQANDPLAVLPVNAMLPHRLSRLCALAGARFIHVSTDCVFSGARGQYTEDDVSDATDLYGKSKYIGEVSATHALTLRTSIIGHELAGRHALVEWFLSQRGPVRGFSRAIFSGLPTVELSRVVANLVLTNPDLHGVYQVASAPISKFDLLEIIAKQYSKKTAIEKDADFVLDRSLNGARFATVTGYLVPTWHELVARMYNFYKGEAYVR
jgi:dTDP-4-dehydrorhamnose reductase